MKVVWGNQEGEKVGHYCWRAHSAQFAKLLVQMLQCEDSLSPTISLTGKHWRTRCVLERIRLTKCVFLPISQTFQFRCLHTPIADERTNLSGNDGDESTASLWKPCGNRRASNRVSAQMLLLIYICIGKLWANAWKLSANFYVYYCDCDVICETGNCCWDGDLEILRNCRRRRWRREMVSFRRVCLFFALYILHLGGFHIARFRCGNPIGAQSCTISESLSLSEIVV